jgi:hypothetical protein
VSFFFSVTFRSTQRWKEHEEAGRGAETFDVGFGTNEIWNYFWDRRPASAIRLHAANQPAKRNAPSNPREQRVPPDHRRLA